MLLEVLDQSTIASGVLEEVHKYYPDARVSHLKGGGNFPYLACSEDVNIFIAVRFFSRGAGASQPLMRPGPPSFSCICERLPARGTRLARSPRR